MEVKTHLPRFVIFEGISGTGKTTLSKLVADKYKTSERNLPLYYGAFPGSEPGTLGNWVYKLHHRQTNDLDRDVMHPVALQLLHVSAHIDTILSRIQPIATLNGSVILDRGWWSTYAYLRRSSPIEMALKLIELERYVWETLELPLPKPIIFYITRKQSLKPHEVDKKTHNELDVYYREIMELEKAIGYTAFELDNDNSIEQLLDRIMTILLEVKDS